MTSIRKNAVILGWLSRSNLRLVMVSLIGLIIALSMLSGCVFFVDFARSDIYLHGLEEIDLNSSRAKYSVYTDPGGNSQYCSYWITQS